MAHGKLTAIHVNHSKNKSKRADSSTIPATCYTGGFYTSPVTSSTVAIDPSQPVTFSWDPTCMPATTSADIYLYAPSTTSASPKVHKWVAIPFASGSYAATLNPYWWNKTADVQLQLGIVNSGDAPFGSRFPAGPVFTATYDSSIQFPVDTSASITYVTGKSPQIVAAAKTEYHKGTTAVAVLIPLIVIAALGTWWFLRMKRKKSAEKTQRFSQALDKRMSTISTDWKSMSGAGANAAIRSSMAAGNRDSSFSFGAIRPSVDENAAGVGSGSLDLSSTRQMSQIRPVIPGVGIGATSTERVSRVSFAADAHPRTSYSNNRLSSAASVVGRPSTDSGVSMRKSRAFHNAYIPPVPVLSSSQAYGSKPSLPEDSSFFSIGEAEKDIVQKLGATSLTDGEIESRLSGEMSPQQSAGINGYTYEQYEQYADLTSPTEAALTSATVGGGYHGYSEDVGGYGEDVSGALSMMRTTNDADNFMLPSQPEPTHAPAFEQYATQYVSQDGPGSPYGGNSGQTTPNAPTGMAGMPMQAVPASVMSPDEMLRAYASARSNSVIGGKFGTTPPAPAYTPGSPSQSSKNPFVRGATPALQSNGGMRTLFTESPSVSVPAGAFAPTSHRASVSSNGSGGRKKSLTGGRIVSEVSRYSGDSGEWKAR